MTTIDADALLPNERMRRGAAAGDVTQIHRGDKHADEGDRFEIDGETFEVVEVRERTLGDLTDEDARREGTDDLEAYRELLHRVHDHFEWNDDSEVVLHRFEKTA
ncbi:hypothetical protein BRC82_02005 [Halobacteriales archaeon QS_1_67_19]|nr:MAG: hypothetical protein BRC82_02005 [Halobacteriales archaeon QS_1_67_19]